MLKSLLIPAVALTPFVLAVACGGSSASNNPPVAGLDNNHDGLADDLYAWADTNGDNKADPIDINHDGKVDGYGVNTTGQKGAAGNALALDLDCDGVYESLDTDGDGLPNLQTSEIKVTPPATCHPVNPVTSGQNSGGAGGTGGTPGSGASAGSPTTGAGGGTVSPDSQLGKATYQGSGNTTAQYAKGDVYRNNVGYEFIANGWGTNWKDHSISWKGTSYTVNSFTGSPGANSAPAGYPTMFCGFYSMEQSDGDCGLPITITAAKSIKTGWRWKANGNTGTYNAVWDIWLGNNNTLTSYLMVWLRDPPGAQPAGAATITNITVAGLPGTWNTWTGKVNGLPIVNYVLPEGKDLSELEFDVLDLYKDAIARNYSLPGAQIMAVATGYEIWSGPISNLATEDFYVDVK